MSAARTRRTAARRTRCAAAARPCAAVRHRHLAGDRLLPRRARAAAVRPLRRSDRLHARHPRQRPSHDRLREVGRPGPAPSEAGTSARSTTSASAQATWPRRALPMAGGSAATCSARTTSTTCAIRGAATPNTPAISTTSRSTQDWKDGDHPPEDSFYMWGPNPPEDFAHNYEVAKEGPANSVVRKSFIRSGARAPPI